MKHLSSLQGFEILSLSAVAVLLILSLPYLFCVLIKEKRARVEADRARVEADRACAEADRACAEAETAGPTFDRPAPLHLSGPLSVQSWLHSLPPVGNAEAAWRQVCDISLSSPPSGTAETTGRIYDVDELCDKLELGTDFLGRVDRHAWTVHEYMLRLMIELRGLWRNRESCTAKSLLHGASVTAVSHRPDLVMTRAMEAMPTVLGALFILEFKSETEKEHGEGQRQLQSYLKSRGRALLEELQESDAPVSAIGDVSAVGAISTGTMITFGRLFFVKNESGNAQKGPMWIPHLSMTAWLPLLPPPQQQAAASASSMRSSGASPPHPPPVSQGFEYLCRVLSAPLKYFGDVTPMPSSILFKKCPLPLRLHLGTDGSCDTFELLASDGAPVILKRPTHGDASGAENLMGEATVLRLLPRCPKLPSFVDMDQGDGTSLLLRPVGKSLRVLSANQKDAAARLLLAQHAAADVLAALRVAHSVGICHGNVCLSNVIYTVNKSEMMKQSGGIATAAGAAGAAAAAETRALPPVTMVLMNWGDAVVKDASKPMSRSEAAEWQHLLADDLMGATIVFDGVLKPTILDWYSLSNPELIRRRHLLCTVSKGRASIREELYVPWWAPPASNASMHVMGTSQMTNSSSSSYEDIPSSLSYEGIPWAYESSPRARRKRSRSGLF